MAYAVRLTFNRRSRGDPEAALPPLLALVGALQQSLFQDVPT